MKELAEPQLTGKQNSFLFPCSWFYAAIRRAGQARLPLTMGELLHKEALETTVLFLHLHKKDNAETGKP